MRQLLQIRVGGLVGLYVRSFVCIYVCMYVCTYLFTYLPTHPAETVVELLSENHWENAASIVLMQKPDKKWSWKTLLMWPPLCHPLYGMILSSFYLQVPPSSIQLRLRISTVIQENGRAHKHVREARSSVLSE